MTTELGNQGQKIAFNEEAEALFQDILRRYPNTRAALLPVLTLAQDEFGYLSVDVMDYVAERVGMPSSKVLAVATFYTMYKKRPTGKYLVQVCTSVPCCMMGGYDLLRKVEDKLGIQCGETTADRRFSIEESECLAACGNGPVLQVDSIYYERMTPEMLDELIENLP